MVGLSVVNPEGICGLTQSKDWDIVFTIKLNEKLQIPLALANANVLCRKIITGMDWRVLEQADTRIRCKEVSMDTTSFSWPAEVEIALAQLADNHTEVVLNGTIFGFGEIQRSHLQEQLEIIRERIELSLTQRAVQGREHSSAKTKGLASAAGDGKSLVTELEKLASLFQQGALTDDEFKTAKKRLLNKID